MNLEQIKTHVFDSIEKSNNNMSKLTNDILRMEGMSGIKTRHLYNNLCSIDNLNYLEIGTWKGSSFISACFQNNINSIVIDNWSEFGSVKEEFLNNYKTYCPDKSLNLFEKDCFQITKDDINTVFNSIDVYLYDGAHDYESQKKAITYYKNFFSEYVIIIIDDFRADTPSNAQVSKGTYDGLNDSGLIVHEKIEISSKQEVDGASGYWNGLGLFICENKNKNI
jgi:hypothetical protein